MQVLCDEHETELIDGRCYQCLEEASKAFDKYCIENGIKSITHGGFHPVTKGWVRVDGKRVEYHHETNYLEYGPIPQAVCAEMSALIEKRLEEYQCNCYTCQRRVQQQLEAVL